MASKQLPYVERKIRRLSREISEIDRHFYDAGINDRDRTMHAGMLERKRDDIVRSTVLQLHTAMEDLLDSLIVCRLLDAKPQTRKARMRTSRGKALDKVLHGGGSIGFSSKVSLALQRISPISTHSATNAATTGSWLNLSDAGDARLNAKPPLLSYKGGDLHTLPPL